MNFEIQNLTELDWALEEASKKAVIMDTHQDEGFNRIYDNITYRQVTEKEAVEIAQKYNIVGFPTLLIYKADKQFDTIDDVERREIQVEVLSKLRKTTNKPEESKQ